MNIFIGSAGEVPHGVDECGPAYIERPRVGQGKRTAGEENSGGAEVVFAERAKVIGQKGDFLQFRAGAGDGFGGFSQSMHVIF